MSEHSDCAHCVLGLNQRFKVVGITQRNNVRQITLLQVPPEFIHFFSSPASHSFDQRMKAMTDEDFAEACSLPVNPALTQPDWVARVAHPIGFANAN